MRSVMEEYRPLIGLGMTSLVLGTIALFLAFLPVLGIPLSFFGILFGSIAIIGGIWRRGLVLRWGLGGTALSCLALGANLALSYAPSNYVPDPRVPPPWQPVPDRPYVSPPAQGRAPAIPCELRPTSNPTCFCRQVMATASNPTAIPATNSVQLKDSGFLPASRPA